MQTGGFSPWASSLDAAKIDLELEAPLGHCGALLPPQRRQRGRLGTGVPSAGCAPQRLNLRVERRAELGAAALDAE